MTGLLAAALGISPLPRKTYSADGAVSLEPQIAILNGADANAQMSLAAPGDAMVGKFLVLYASSVANTVDLDLTDAGGARTITFVRTNDPVIVLGLTSTVWMVVKAPVGGTLTQTYATANATHAARTAADLTENSSAIGGTNDGDIPALVDPAGDSGASVIAGIRENATMINALRADQVDTAQFLNSLVDELQARGVIG